MSLLVAATLLAIGVVSKVVYVRADQRAADSGRATHGAVGWFGPLVPVLRLAVILPAVLAPFTDSPWLLWTHRPSTAVAIVSLAGALAGFALFLASMKTLGDSYSPCFDKRVPGAVVMKGPYRCVRHPVYTANLLVIFSAWLAVGSGWTLVSGIVTTAGYWLSLREEERVLREKHPAYADYQATVGCLVPLLSRKDG